MDIFSIFSFSSDFVEMMVRFVICTLFNWFIIDRLYYRKCKRRDYYFTFLLTSIISIFSRKIIWPLMPYSGDMM